MLTTAADTQSHRWDSTGTVCLGGSLRSLIVNTGHPVTPGNQTIDNQPKANGQEWIFPSMSLLPTKVHFPSGLFDGVLTIPQKKDLRLRANQPNKTLIHTFAGDPYSPLARGLLLIIKGYVRA